MVVWPTPFFFIWPKLLASGINFFRLISLLTCSHDSHRASSPGFSYLQHSHHLISSILALFAHRTLFFEQFR